MKNEQMKLAFVDMEFHKKTKSGDFLREIFSTNFVIQDFWYDHTKERPGELMKELVNYDYVFFFQVLLPYKDMLYLRRKNIKIIWAPMYDGLPMSRYYWKKIASLKIKLLCFSGAITQKAVDQGIDHHSYRFFKKPAFDSTRVLPSKLNIFFWYRGNIAFYDWIRFVQNLPVNKIVYLSRPDPGYEREVILEEDIKKYNIQIISESFIKQEDYINYVNESDIYICPRKQEGIGMTLVEALAMGKFLIGYKDYTMIDYIIHKKNGFLFNKDTTEIIDMKDMEASVSICQTEAINGYGNWEISKKKISGLFFEYHHSSALQPGIANRFFVLIEKVKKIIKKFK